MGLPRSAVSKRFDTGSCVSDKHHVSVGALGALKEDI